MRALVTGAAGFIGSHLCDRLLAYGADVVGVDSLTPFYGRARKMANLHSAIQSPRFHFRNRDLVDGIGASLRGVTHVFHLAGQPGVRASWEDFARYQHDNVQATYKLLSELVDPEVEVSLERAICISTSAVYGDRAPHPLREDGPTGPVSPYGVTKLAAEHLASMFHEVHGLPIVTLRYFSVFGPRQRPDMAFSILIDKALAGESFTMFGDGSNTRDYTYVDDVVTATIAAAERGVPGETYNIAGGCAVSLRNAIHHVASALQRPIEITPSPLARGDMRHTVADTSRAARTLGFAPATSFSDGIAAQVAWALAQSKVAA